MIFSFIIMLAAAFASPEVQEKNVFVESQMQFGMKIEGLHYWEDSGFAGTGIGKKNGVDSINHSVYSYRPNGRYYDSRNLEYNLSAYMTIGKSQDDFDAEYDKQIVVYEKLIKEIKKNVSSCERCSEELPPRPQRPDWTRIYRGTVRQIRKSNLDLHIVEDSAQTMINVKLADIQVHKKFKFGGGWDLQSTKDHIKGKLKVGYRLPENTWAVVFEVRRRTGVFNLPQIYNGIQNAFNSNLQLVGDRKYIVWGKPGTDVYQEFNFDNYSQGSNIEGEIETIIKPIDFASVQTKSIEQIVNFIFNIQAYSSNTTFDKHLENVKHIVYLLSKPEIRDSMMNALTTNKIIQLIGKLSETAYGYEAVAYAWDLKAASTVLAHELALAFLKQIIPFCRNEKIVLPYSKAETQILGLKLANFFLEKAKLRLQYEHFKHYDTLLKLLSSYNGKTFSQVRKDPKEILKIKKAYDVLTNTIDMRLSSFKAANDEIKFIYEKFGSLGAPGSDNVVIFKMIGEISGKDSEFNNSLLSFLREFQEDNRSVISTRDLVGQLQKIIADQNSIVEQIDQKVKIAGFTPTESSATFLQSVQAMTIHNIEILTEPLSGSFENFRKSYFDSNRVMPVLNQVQNCVR